MNKISCKERFCKERFETVPYGNLNQLIAKAAAKLEKADITNPRLESELLLSHLLSLSRFDLYLKEIEFNGELIDKFERLLLLRSKKYPLQYITGRANFMGLDFAVNPDVLIPRPETEILVEIALGHLKNSRLKEPAILDIGTGCGNTAISLTKHLTNCKIWATDISPQALKVARYNASFLGANDKINFILGDIWPKAKQKFDIIVSNPPYIKRGDFDSLSAEVKFEPRLALDGGEKGLDFYYRIITKSGDYLNPEGYLMLELGDGQFADVKQIVSSVPELDEPQIIKDLNNKERFIITQKK